jgi:tetratricopeptide (TPR) repeat protein
MNRLLKLICLLLLVGCCNTLAFAADESQLARQAEQTGNLREALTHYVEVLKSSPLNQQLREKIINIAQKINPPPLLPQEALKHMARGKAALGMARDSSGFLKAVDEYEKAVYFAPWYADAYFNLGVVSEKAGRYKEAIEALKAYLQAKLNAEDVNQVQMLIYEIEYKLDSPQGCEKQCEKYLTEAEKQIYDKCRVELEGGRPTYTRSPDSKNYMYGEYAFTGPAETIGKCVAWHMPRVPTGNAFQPYTYQMTEYLKCIDENCFWIMGGAEYGYRQKHKK